MYVSLITHIIAKKISESDLSCKYLCYNQTHNYQIEANCSLRRYFGRYLRAEARCSMYNIEVLEKKRLEKGLSYTEIAEKLGIHKVTVSRTLKGVTMKPRTVKLLADYLGVEMNRIVQ